MKIKNRKSEAAIKVMRDAASDLVVLETQVEPDKTNRVTYLTKSQARKIAAALLKEVELLER